MNNPATPAEFQAMPSAARREFLARASAREALAVGVAAVCGTCGEPLADAAEAHHCDAERLAELAERSAEG